MSLLAKSYLVLTAGAKTRDLLIPSFGRITSRAFEVRARGLEPPIFGSMCYCLPGEDEYVPFRYLVPNSGPLVVCSFQLKLSIVAVRLMPRTLSGI